MEIIIFTNENYIDILNITLPRFVKYLEPLNIKINVVTNKFVNNTNIDFSGVNVIETGVDFNQEGGHFRTSMYKTLTSLNSEYFFFFCDDYMINNLIKKDVFDNVVNVIKHYDCDFLSFASLRFTGVHHRWNILNNDLKDFNINQGILYQIDDDYRHLYSVQPCIWKTKSFLTLLEHNPDLSLHMLDNTNIKNKKGFYRGLMELNNYYESNDETKLDYGFINLAIDLPPFSYNIDDRDLHSDYFVLDYGEIVRHGKLLNQETNTVKILNTFLEENPEIKNKVSKFR